MRAIQIDSFGGPGVLAVRDVPIPEVGPGQIRVRVVAAAANPVDVQTRSGDLLSAGVMSAGGTVGLGWDIAGVVDALGPHTEPFEVGDAVIALSDRLALPLKGQAEFAVVNVSAAARVEGGSDLVELSALPLSGLTALQSLNLSELVAGNSILITGAAGAVGGYAVQLAERRGLRVVASGRPSDEAGVRALGAEVFIPQDDGLAEHVRLRFADGVDGVIDAATAGLAALDALKGGGTFVSLLGTGPLPLRGTRVRSVWIRADGDQLKELAEANLNHRVVGRHALDDVVFVHELLERRGRRGRHVFVL